MIRQLWQHYHKALIAFAIAVVAVLYFGFQTLTHALYWNYPAHRDQALAGWMTPRYVANSYAIPPEVFARRCTWTLNKSHAACRSRRLQMKMT
jgi:hypothetical protein